MNKSVYLKTPLRVSLLGGGTDFKSFYSENLGCVLSFAINKYIYIFMKELSDYFDEKYRLNYFITERVENVDDIDNDITRESIKLQKFDKKLYISTIADIPQSSGLGSSSSFAAGINLGLRALVGEEPEKNIIAKDAIEIEINKLRKPIGIQDQVATTFGGLNYIEFSTEYEDHYRITKIKNSSVYELIQENLLLVWTGVHRKADDILADQEKKSLNNKSNLIKLSKATRKFYENSKQKFDIFELGNLLNETWELKKQLGDNISNSHFDEIYKKGIAAGAIGGKLLGAGGGGFFLFVVEKYKQPTFRKKMEPFIMENFKINESGVNLIDKNF